MIIQDACRRLDEAFRRFDFYEEDRFWTSLFITFAIAIQALVGQDDMAKETVQQAFSRACSSIGDNRSRALLLNGVAFAQALSGRENEARGTIRKVLQAVQGDIDPEWRARVLPMISIVQAAVGQSEEAEATFHEALQAALTIESDYGIRELINLARVVVAQNEEVKELFKRDFPEPVITSEGFTYGMILRLIIQGLREQEKEAEETLRDIEEALQQAYKDENQQGHEDEFMMRWILTAGTAEFRARLGQYERAIQTARQIEDPRYRAFAIARVATVLLEHSRR